MHIYYVHACKNLVQNTGNLGVGEGKHEKFPLPSCSLDREQPVVISATSRHYAPINVMPHHPPPGLQWGNCRGIDMETDTPYTGI